jgi:predicted enzyme related to lactoylglutathione lyase
MTKIAHFEITSPDPRATAEFYKTVFGWRVTDSQFIPGYYLLELVDNEGGAVMDRKYQSQPTIIWFEVDDIDAYVGAITKAGGKAVNEKQSMPGVGHLIYVADPAGTVFGLKQPE